MRRALSMTALMLALTGCGAAAPVRHAAAATAATPRPAATPTSAPTPATPPGPFLVVLEGGGPQTGADAVALVTPDGRTVARASFAPWKPPYLTNVADIRPPAAQAGPAGAYVMDGNGVLRLLGPAGQWDVVASFPATPGRSDTWFSVSPDGGSVLAGVITAPPAGPKQPNDPWPPLQGAWTFDLDSATAGGTTQVLRHEESASGVEAVFPIGWTADGPVAMVGASLATQNEWWGGPLYSIDDSGRQTARLAGDCTAARILPSGLVPCTDSRMTVTVRNTAGQVQWRPALQGFDALRLSLSPSGDAITEGRNVATRTRTVALADGFTAEGWFDSTTLVGRAANGHVGTVRIDDPLTVHDLGVAGDFAGVVAG